MWWFIEDQDSLIRVENIIRVFLTTDGSTWFVGVDVVGSDTPIDLIESSEEECRKVFKMILGNIPKDECRAFVLKEPEYRRVVDTGKKTGKKS